VENGDLQSGGKLQLHGYEVAKGVVNKTIMAKLRELFSRCSRLQS